MDVSLSTQARSPRPWRLFGASLVTLALVVSLAAAPASATSPTACRVRNLTHPEGYRTLAAAVKAAKNRDRLTVRGTCTGTTRITNKRLTVTGVRTRISGPPTFRGNGRGPVVTVGGDAGSVTFRNLAITGRAGQVLDYDGGGISNALSVVTLEDVTIRGFTTRQGGGIANTEGTVRLVGSSSVRANRAEVGGGIYDNGGTVILGGSSSVSGNRADSGGGVASLGNFGSVTLNGSSSVSGNTADGYGGGGLYISGTLTMNDSSSVSGNTALIGGGIRNGGSVALNDSSSVSGNAADEYGGGIENGYGTLTMTGSSSVTGNVAALYGGGVNDNGGDLTGIVCAPAPGANVHDNNPDDCHLE